MQRSTPDLRAFSVGERTGMLACGGTATAAAPATKTAESFICDAARTLVQLLYLDMSMLPFVLAVPPRAPAFLGAPLSSWEAQRRLVSDDVRARAESHNGSYPALNLTNAQHRGCSA